MATPVIDMWAPVLPVREIMAHIAENFPEAMLGLVPAAEIAGGAGRGVSRPARQAGGDGAVARRERGEAAGAGLSVGSRSAPSGKENVRREFNHVSAWQRISFPTCLASKNRSAIRRAARLCFS